jgi:hypothetical protein
MLRGAVDQLGNFGAGCRPGASDGHGTGLRIYRASPDFMGLVSLGLDIGIFGGVLYSVLLLNATLGLLWAGWVGGPPHHLRL